MKCPKCSYERKTSDTEPEWQCPSCGIVYSKFVSQEHEDVTYMTSISNENMTLTGIVKWPLIIALSLIFMYEISGESLSAFALNSYARYDSITEGVIVESKLKLKGFKYGSEYKIVYRYNVKGSIFDSGRINLSRITKDAASMVEKYPKGKVVKVFYDPNKPHHAVLENDGLSYRIYVELFIAFCVLFGGIGINIYSYNKGRSGKNRGPSSAPR